MQAIAWLAGLAAAFAPSIAYAYTGPGLGLGALVTVLAVIFSGILAVLAIFWYPVKRLFRRRRRSAADAADDAMAHYRKNG